MSGYDGMIYNTEGTDNPLKAFEFYGIPARFTHVFVMRKDPSSLAKLGTQMIQTNGKTFRNHCANQFSEQAISLFARQDSQDQRSLLIQTYRRRLHQVLQRYLEKSAKLCSIGIDHAGLACCS